MEWEEFKDVSLIDAISKQERMCFDVILKINKRTVIKNTARFVHFKAAGDLGSRREYKMSRKLYERPGSVQCGALPAWCYCGS